MKISFQMDGGFASIPGLNRPVTFDTAQMDPQVANRLVTLVRDSRFFDQPASIKTMSEGGADYRSYTITVQDGARNHTVQLTDPVADPHLEQLVSQLQSMARP